VSSTNIASKIEDLFQPLGPTFQQVAAQLVEVLNALSFEGQLQLQAGVQAGIDTNFLIEGNGSLSSLADSFFIKANDLIDVYVDFDAEATFTPSQFLPAPLAMGPLPSPQWPSVSCCSSPPTVSDVVQAGSDIGNAIVEGATDVVNAGVQILSQALDFVAHGKASFGMTGSFNVSLADPDQDGTLRASEVLQVINSSCGPLGLVRINADLSARASGELSVLGKTFGPASIDEPLLNFSSDCVLVNGVGSSNADASTPARPFAESGWDGDEVPCRCGRNHSRAA
jgi:hypothetical protein